MLRRLWPVSIIIFLTSITGAAQSVDSLLLIVESGEVDSSYVRALGKLADHYRGKDFDKTVYYLKEILRHDEIDPESAGKAYVSLANTYGDKGAFDSADYFLSKAHEQLSRYPKEITLKSMYHNGMGLLAKKKGDNQEALKHYKVVESLGEAGMGRENIAGNLLNIANTYTRMGNYRESSKYLFKALPMFEKLENEKGMSYCYNALGQVLKLQGNKTEAEKYFRKSLELKEQKGDKRGIANTCNELALLHIDLGRLPEALDFVERTIAISEEVSHQELHVIGFINKGKILRMQGRLDEAEAVFKKAGPIAEKFPGGYVRSGLQSELGKLYLEKEQNKKAVTQLVSSIHEAEESSNMEAQLNGHLFLSQTYAKVGDYKAAYDAFQKYHALADSVRGRQLKVEFKALETQYQVDKKNAEIALLKKDQELKLRTLERQRAVQTGIGIVLVSVIVISGLLINRYRVISRAKRLLEVERIRNSIARDLHDDIGSTLSSINIVSQVALKGPISGGGNQEHFGRIAEQSASLMERMSDIVWSINPHNDSLPMLVAKMKEFAAEILEPLSIKFSMSAEDVLGAVTLEVEKRKNVFLIFKEAVNNAAKYSGATEIDVRFQKSDQAIVMKITDNGAGFDLTKVERGNGLRNMRERSDAISGKLAVTSSEGEGTSVSLRFPVT